MKFIQQRYMLCFRNVFLDGFSVANDLPRSCKDVKAYCKRCRYLASLFRDIARYCTKFAFWPPNVYLLPTWKRSHWISSTSLMWENSRPRLTKHWYCVRPLWYNVGVWIRRKWTGRHVSTLDSIYRAQRLYASRGKNAVYMHNSSLVKLINVIWLSDSNKIQT